MLNGWIDFHPIKTPNRFCDALHAGLIAFELVHKFKFCQKFTKSFCSLDGTVELNSLFVPLLMSVIKLQIFM